MSTGKPIRLAYLTIGLVLFAVCIGKPVAFALNISSMDFERDNSHDLSIADADQTGLDISGQITVETWVKLESPITSTNFGVVSKGETSNLAYSFRIRDAGSGENDLSFAYSGNGAAITEREWVANIPVGQWTHVAVTVDPATQTIKFYKNGVENTGLASGVANSISDSSSAFLVGNDSFGGNRNFDGLMDDVRVWNVVRTQAEIAANMNVELAGNEPGLVGYWKLNGSLEDATSNNNDLTNTNAATFSGDMPFGGTPSPSLTFSASPEMITQGESATLEWSSVDTASCTASNGWSGGKSISGSEVVSPSATTLYELDCEGEGGSIHKETSVMVTPAPAPPSIVRKSTNESVSKSTILQNDDELTLPLAANTRYVVDGVVFASAVNASPDIKIGFSAPSGSDVTLSYIAEGASRMLGNNTASGRIALPANTAVPIYVHGTIQTGSASGNVQLAWTQFASKVQTTNVLKGSYLRVNAF